MHIDGPSNPPIAPGLGPDVARPETPEEAARQFEQVLIRQMVSTMTREIFDSSLSGEDGPGWMNSYSEMQSDLLANELAAQLSKRGNLGIAEMLLRQWSRQELVDGATSDSEPSEVNP